MVFSVNIVTEKRRTSKVTWKIIVSVYDLVEC